MKEHIDFLNDMVLSNDSGAMDYNELRRRFTHAFPTLSIAERTEVFAQWEEGKERNGMLSFTKQIADRRSALMQLNQEARGLRALLLETWEDEFLRQDRPVLWARVERALKETKRHDVV